MSPAHASDLLTNLTTATTSLYNAQTALSNLLGIVNNSDDENFDDEVFTPTTSTITNNATGTIFLAMFNQANQQINPTIIGLNPGQFSYIPGNVTSVQIVDQNKKQLVAAMPLALNSLYSVTNSNNTWKMAIAPAHMAYSYKNASTVSVIIALTAGNNVAIQKLAPNVTYISKPMDSATQGTINAHANISALFAAYNPAMGYTMSIDANNMIALTPNATNKMITNNTGWPMLLHLQNTDKVACEDIILLSGSNYASSDKIKAATHIMVVPMIPNYNSTAAVLKSGSITNSKGQLALQF